MARSVAVTICGLPATGKSTLVAHLAAHMDVNHLLEPRLPPSLTDSIAILPNHRFMAEVYFLQYRLAFCLERASSNSLIVFDRWFDEDVLVYAKTWREMGALTGQQFDVLAALAAEINSTLDSRFNRVVLSLDCAPSVLLDRLRVRGQSGDDEMNEKMLLRLRGNHDSWIESVQTPVVRLDTTHFSDRDWAALPTACANWIRKALSNDPAQLVLF